VQGRSPAGDPSLDLYESLKNFYKTFFSQVKDDLTGDIGGVHFKVSGGYEGMDVRVENKGVVLFTVKANVTADEHAVICGHTWYKRKGQPCSSGIGFLYDYVASLREPGENLFPDSNNLVPVRRGDKIVAFAEVDHDDHPDLVRHEWILTRDGYAQFYNKILKTFVSMHRYIMDFPEGLVVDHVHWNRLDNRRDHLRICTKGENALNIAPGRVTGWWRFLKR